MHCSRDRWNAGRGLCAWCHITLTERGEIDRVYPRITALDRYQELRKIGVPIAEIPGRLGVKAASVVRMLYRNGLTVPAELVSEESAERRRRRTKARH